MFRYRYSGDYILKIYFMGEWYTYKDTDRGFSMQLFNTRFWHKTLKVYKEGKLDKKLEFDVIWESPEALSLPGMDYYFTTYLNTFSRDDTTIHSDDKLSLLKPELLTSYGVYNLVKFAIYHPEVSESLNHMLGKNDELDKYINGGIRGAINISYNTGHLDFAEKLSTIRLGLEDK